MKKLLLVSTALLTLACLTNCSNSDDNDTNYAPDKMTGKVLIGSISVQTGQGWQEVTSSTTTYSFISDSSISYVDDGHTSSATYVYKKTGNNTATLNIVIDTANAYDFNVTFEANSQVNATGNFLGEDYTMPAKFSGRMAQ